MRAVLDACVLFPTVVRELLIDCAAQGLFVPLWSDRILEEWRRAVIRAHPEQADQVAAEIAGLVARFADASVSVPPGASGALSLPDDNDRHVLAAAIAGGAETLVTLNLKDFPGRTLARHGVLVRHPDSLLLEFWQEDPGQIASALDRIVGPLERSTGLTRRAILKRARLPRLGKAAS